MTTEEIRSVVFQCFRRIAPEIAPEEIDPKVPFRSQLDIDSMDYLNIMICIHNKLGVEIPEEDYGRLTTIDRTITYLCEAMSARAPQYLSADREIAG
jgi:acyl carrier protein